MKTLSIAIAALLMWMPAQAASIQPQLDDDVTISFVDVGSSDASMTAAGTEAWVDLNTVAHQTTDKERSTRVVRRFGVRVDRRSGVPGGAAVVSARLESVDGRASLRIDGRTLTSAAIVVDAHSAIGSMAVHTLEIEVPVTVPEGALTASIAWEVSTK